MAGIWLEAILEMWLQISTLDGNRCVQDVLNNIRNGSARGELLSLDKSLRAYTLYSSVRQWQSSRSEPNWDVSMVSLECIGTEYKISCNIL